MFGMFDPMDQRCDEIPFIVEIVIGSVSNWFSKFAVKPRTDMVLPVCLFLLAVVKDPHGNWKLAREIK